MSQRGVNPSGPSTPGVIFLSLGQARSRAYTTRAEAGRAAAGGGGSANFETRVTARSQPPYKYARFFVEEQLLQPEPSDSSAQRSPALLGRIKKGPTARGRAPFGHPLGPPLGPSSSRASHRLRPENDGVRVLAGGMAGAPRGHRGRGRKTGLTPPAPRHRYGAELVRRECEGR